LSQAEHVSVLLEESVAALAIKPDGIYLDRKWMALKRATYTRPSG